MAFQKQVNQTQALGSAGQISKAFHNYCNTFSAIAGDNKICVGCFVQSTSGTNEREVIDASGEAITGKILGVVVKDHYISSETETHIYREGDNVTIINAGNVFIECESVATAGQYVFLKDDNGTLVFNNTNTLADHTYTGWRVAVGNKAPYADNGIIEITTANA